MAYVEYNGGDVRIAQEAPKTVKLDGEVTVKYYIPKTSLGVWVIPQVTTYESLVGESVGKGQVALYEDVVYESAAAIAEVPADFDGEDWDFVATRDDYISSGCVIMKDSIGRGSLIQVEYPFELGSGQTNSYFKYYKVDGATVLPGTTLYLYKDVTLEAVYDHIEASDSITITSTNNKVKISGNWVWLPDASGTGKPLAAGPVALSVAIKDKNASAFQGSARYVWDRPGISVTGDIVDGAGTLTIGQSDELVNLEYPLDILFAASDGIMNRRITVVSGEGPLETSITEV